MAVSTYGSISQRTGTYAEAKMLSHAMPVIVLGLLAQQRPIPKNKANNVKFRRPIPFTAATVPLQEGVTPTSKKLSYEDVLAVLQQYGEVYETTDVVNDLCEDPVLNDMMSLAGENVGRTTEAVTYGVVKAGSTVYYANGNSRPSVNTPITIGKQRKIKAFLQRSKGQKLREILNPSPNYATKAIEAAFVAVCHTDLDSDIRSMPGFTPTAEYGTRTVICPEEIGTVEDVRYITSADLAPFPDAGGLASGVMISTTGTQADVYPVLYFAKEAFGQVTLKGRGNVAPRVLNPDDADKSDPLGQRGLVSWKTYFTAVILNDTWMARLECAATAN